MPKPPTFWMAVLLVIAAIVLGTVIGEGIGALSDALVEAFPLG